MKGSIGTNEATGIWAAFWLFSLSVSLSTHTHTSAKSRAHMCQCILEMSNHNEEFNRCQGLTLSIELPIMALCSRTHTHPASSSFVLHRVVPPWAK